MANKKWSIALKAVPTNDTPDDDMYTHPGDIVAFKEYADKDKWTAHERKRFLICWIDDLKLDEIQALVRPEYDIASWKIKKKRKYQITVYDLQVMGVDKKKLYDPDFLYDLDLEIKLEKIKDKSKDKKLKDKPIKQKKQK